MLFLTVDVLLSARSYFCKPFSGKAVCVCVCVFVCLSSDDAVSDIICFSGHGRSLYNADFQLNITMSDCQ